MSLRKAVRKAHQYKHLKVRYYRLGLGDRMPTVIQEADSSLQNLESHKSQQAFFILLTAPKGNVTDFINSMWCQ